MSGDFALFSAFAVQKKKKKAADAVVLCASSAKLEDYCDNWRKTGGELNDWRRLAAVVHSTVPNCMMADVADADPSPR